MRESAGKVLLAPKRRRQKWAPHQGRRERARRLRQVRRGVLKGPHVTDAARYAAHGLVGPDALKLVTER